MDEPIAEGVTSVMSGYIAMVFGHPLSSTHFESLLGIRGVGPKSVRALSLVSEIIYGKEPSYSDPARFSYAHGGKDGTPLLVKRLARYYEV